jgi:hypothetical protein
MNVNKPIIREWIAELRNPDNKQCYERLKNIDGSRCCLGVLSDIAVKNNIIPEPKIYRHGYIYKEAVTNASTTTDLLLSIEDWMGFSHTNGNLTIKLPITINTTYQVLIQESMFVSLVDLNDNEKLTFPQIADIIEWYYLS